VGTYFDDLGGFHSLIQTSAPSPAVLATSGTPQSVPVHSAFADLQATVVDASGDPVQGATVTFSVPGRGASGHFAKDRDTALTDAEGVATAPTLRANGKTGSYVVTASVAGVPISASFDLTNLAAAQGTGGPRRAAPPRRQSSPPVPWAEGPRTSDWPAPALRAMCSDPAGPGLCDGGRAVGPSPPSGMNRVPNAAPHGGVAVAPWDTLDAFVSR
jgi:hypothetical protein